MADAPKTRRKSTGPRKQRPVFAIVTYVDEAGNAQQLNKDHLNIQIERDSAKIVEALTGGGMQNATVVRVELPQPQARTPAASQEQSASA